MGNLTTNRGVNLDWYGRELTSYTKDDNTLNFTFFIIIIQKRNIVNRFFFYITCGIHISIIRISV